MAIRYIIFSPFMLKNLHGIVKKIVSFQEAIQNLKK